MQATAARRPLVRAMITLHLMRDRLAMATARTAVVLRPMVTAQVAGSSVVYEADGIVRQLVAYAPLIHGRRGRGRSMSNYYEEEFYQSLI
ncbi:MAG: hypothetical protein SOI46_04040 [Eggerthellaceae bacterium]